MSSASLRVLYYADIRFPLERANGIQTMETCHALARRGHFVTLVVRPDTVSPSRDPFAFYDLPLIARLRIEYAPVTGPAIARRAGYLAFAIGRAIGSSRADVVMTRDLGVASALLRIPRWSRPAVVYESHGYSPEVAAALPALVATAEPPGPRKLARLKRREARVWRAADGYVTITSALAADLESRFGARRAIAVVPDGARVADREQGIPSSAGHSERPQAGVEHSDEARDGRNLTRTVAYAGHLYAWKGVDVLLEALTLLPAVRGLIIGGHEKEPDLGRLKQQANRLGIADRCTFTGLVPPGEVARWLRAANVLVLPNPASAISTRFTSPLKLFEYMASGRPIVASNLPAIAEVLADQEHALLVQPGDPAALAAGVRRLLDDRVLAERLARAALGAVREYSWDRRGERLERLFQQVSHSPP